MANGRVTKDEFFAICLRTAKSLHNKRLKSGEPNLMTVEEEAQYIFDAVWDNGSAWKKKQLKA